MAPIQPLSAPVAESHEFPRQSDPAPGAKVIAAGAQVAFKYHEFRHPPGNSVVHPDQQPFDEDGQRDLIPFFPGYHSSRIPFPAVVGEAR